MLRARSSSRGAACGRLGDRRAGLDRACDSAPSRLLSIGASSGSGGDHPLPARPAWRLVHIDAKKLGRIIQPGHRVTGDRRQRARGNAGWRPVRRHRRCHQTGLRRALPGRDQRIGDQLPGRRSAVLPGAPHHHRTRPHRQRTCCARSATGRTRQTDTEASATPPTAGREVYDRARPSRATTAPTLQHNRPHAPRRADAIQRVNDVSGTHLGHLRTARNSGYGVGESLESQPIRTMRGRWPSFPPWDSGDQHPGGCLPLIVTADNTGCRCEAVPASHDHDDSWPALPSALPAWPTAGCVCRASWWRP